MKSVPVEMTQIYLTAQRKNWHHEVLDGWKETYFNRGEYIESAIYEKPTAELTNEDKEWVEEHGTMPDEWV